MSVDIARLQLEADSTQIRSATRDLQTLERQGNQTERQMGSMATVASKLGAALAAAFTVHQISQFVKETALMYARFETLGVVMNTVGRNAGYSQQQMAGLEQELRRTGIAGIEARTVLTRMTQAQIDLTNASKLARIAQDAAVIGNINSSEAFERMIHGIQSAQVEVLRNIGINVNFEQSYKAIATQLGVTTAELTETQKAQARVNVVMEAGAGIAGVYEASMDTASKQLASMKRYTDDLKVSIGETFNEALVLLVKQATLELKSMQNTMKGLKEDGSLDQWGANFATVVAGTMDIILLVTATITSVTSTISAAIKQMRAVAEAVYDILSLDFKGAKENIQQFTQIGIEWWDKMQEKWTSPTFTDTLKAMRKEAEIASKAFQDTYDLDFGSWSDGLKTGVDNITEAVSYLNHTMYEADFGDSSNWLAEYKQLMNLQDEIRYMEDWIELVESGLTTQEATLEIEEKRLRVRLENQGLNGPEIDHYIEQLGLMRELTQAEQDRNTTTDEYNKKQEKARQEYEREWERVYDNMHEFATDTFYDIFDGQLDSFEDFADSMLDIFKRMLANMVAEAAMTNIFKPIMSQLAGSALGNMFGLPGSNASGFNIPGLSNLFVSESMATGGASAGMLYPGGISGSVPAPFGATGVSWGAALGAGALGGFGYSALGGALGLPQSPYSGLTAGLGAAGMSAYGGSLAGVTGIGALGGPIGIAAGALLGGLVGGLFDDDPDPRLAVRSGYRPDSGQYPGEINSPGGYGYNIWLQDVGKRAEVGDAITSYFDSLFSSLDAQVSFSLKDILNSSDFDARVNPDDYEGDMTRILSAMSQDLFGDLQAGLEQALLGVDLPSIDLDFFKAITPQGGSLWDAFSQFSTVFQNTEDFMAEFSRRIDDLGLSAEDAYFQIQTVTGVLSEMGLAIDAIANSSVIATIDNLRASWAAYIEELKLSNATDEQIEEAKRKKGIAGGSAITGLTQASIAQALKSGSTIDDILANSVSGLIAEKQAENIFGDMTSMLQEVDRVWEETGGSIEAVNQALKDAGYMMENEKTGFVKVLDLVKSGAKWAADGINDLRDAFEDFQNQLEENRYALDDAINAEQQLIASRLSAADQIDALLFDLQGGTLAPVQSMEFFERRYEQLLAEAQTATTAEDIERAVSNLTSFVPKYLEFAQGYGPGYKELFAKITSDLKEIEIDQRSEAERQLAQLEDINFILGTTATSVQNIEQALQAFLGQTADQGTLLRALLVDIKNHPVVEGLIEFANTNPLVKLGKNILGFDNGGTVMGPDTGYTMPVTFHGKEHIVNDENMQEIKRLVSQNRSGPVTVIVKMGTREFHDYTVEVLETNPVAQGSIQRIARAAS